MLKALLSLGGHGTTIASFLGKQSGCFGIFRESN